MADNLPTVEDDRGNVQVLPPEGGRDPLALQAKLISTLPAGEQFRILKQQICGDRDHLREFFRCATEAFAFRAGEQWTEEDKAILRDQDRPVIVFNRVLTFLKAVAGMEVNGRHETTFFPRGVEDSEPNEILNAVNRWMEDECDAADEQGDAFDKCATCGIGYTETRMSYDDDPAGKYVEESIDPREMVYDRTARKKGLSDARRMARIRKMPLGDAATLFPGYTKEQLDAKWAVDQDLDVAAKSIEEKRRRDSDYNGDALYDDQYEVTIVHVQWIEKEPYWLVADVATNTKMELTDDEYQMLRERLQRLGMGELPAVRLLRKSYKQAFLGDTLLRAAEPAPLGNRFSWHAVTGEFDDVNRVFFGLVKVLRDPQMWANKWLSQVLHILNTTAKGGILAEEDAFPDQREAEDGYARPDTITWVASGALSGQKPKLMPKPGTPMADGYVNLLQFAISSFRDVVGINLELLGQQDQNQPGVLEAMRKQAGMTILATLFNSLARFRRNVGRARLYIIQKYLSDDRIIHVSSDVIGGDDSAKLRAVRVAKDKTTGDYNVVVDDAPTSPNQKEATWLIIQPLMAVFKEQLMANPEILMVLLEYSPLPSRIVAAIKKVMVESANDPQAQAERQQQTELMMRGAMAKIMRDESAARRDDASAQLNMAKVQSESTGAVYDMAMARNLLEDNEFNQMRNLIDMMAKRAQLRTAEASAFTAQAKADRERAGIDVDAFDAETRRLQAQMESRRDATGQLIDTLAAEAKARRDDAAAVKDYAVARREERMPAVPVRTV